MSAPCSKAPPLLKIKDYNHRPKTKNCITVCEKLSQKFNERPGALSSKYGIYNTKSRNFIQMR